MADRYPHPRPKVRPLSDQDRAQIFQSLGAASMCWDPQPTGTFDSEKAKEVGEALIAFLEIGDAGRSYPTSPGRLEAAPGRLARAYCGHCGKMVALRKTGTFREHHDPVTVSNAIDGSVTRMLCRGTNQTPEQVWEVVQRAG